MAPPTPATTSRLHGVEIHGPDAGRTVDAPLDTLSAADQKTFATYNQPPYINGSAGGIPFLDLGGSYLSAGASLDPQLLAGKSHRQIVASLSDPASPIAQAVDGSANVITAALCEVTGQQPTGCARRPA